MNASKPEFRPSGVITLTTDLGPRGPFVATMKGVILSRFASAKIIDLTHEIPVQWPAEAAFWLSHAYRYFPRGTVHVAVVDPGVGTSRDIIAGVRDGHAFIAPDNGQLGSILGELTGTPAVHRVDLSRLQHFRISRPSVTFHGRDIIAPLAADLASGALDLDDLGPPTPEIVPSWVEEPTVSRARVSGVVITVDSFGNLYTNIDAPHIRPLRNPVVNVAGHDIKVRRTYADVKPGEYVALINSFGVLEIARAEQRAADGLGVGRGAPVTVRELG
ncbi:MAG: SAM-dependent chlorinase/fluorinase [Myxococcales bacterium]|nr:SAM-dependent chlorinase/fluorinase [Myxococcales bacterium]MCB9750678.1 SAM-dependent chlorinase/fluorinase [Myxococcales bacterium]